MYSRRLPLASLALFVFCLSSAPAVKADEIAVWNFNDGNLIVDRGQGTLTTTATNITFSSGTTFNASMGDPAGLALTIPGGVSLQNNGSVLEVHINTAGFENVHVTWAWQRTDTGFNDDLIQEPNTLQEPNTNIIQEPNTEFMQEPNTKNEQEPNTE